MTFTAGVRCALIIIRLTWFGLSKCQQHAVGCFRPSSDTACPDFKFGWITSATGPHKSAAIHKMKVESFESLFLNFSNNLNRSLEQLWHGCEDVGALMESVYFKLLLTIQPLPVFMSLKKLLCPHVKGPVLTNQYPWHDLISFSDLLCIFQCLMSTSSFLWDNQTPTMQVLIRHVFWWWKEEVA